jgi:hypothetical protein
VKCSDPEGSKAENSRSEYSHFRRVVELAGAAIQEGHREDHTQVASKGGASRGPDPHDTLNLS